MKYRLLPVVMLAFSSVVFAQSKVQLWKSTTKKSDMVPLESRMVLPEKQIFSLDLDAMRSSLLAAPKRLANGSMTGNQIISIPNADGISERYRIVENSTMAPELQAKYPEIRSYVGENLDSPGTTAYFSVSPLGFKAMMLKPGKSAEFIEPISADLTTYTAHSSPQKPQAPVAAQ